MSQSISVSDIIEDVRVRCDLPTFSTTTFITTAAVLRMVAESASRLSAILHQTFGDDYFTTTSDIVTVANTATVALPTNFTKLRRVHWVRSTDDLVPLEAANSPDEWISSPAGWAWAGAPKYALQQNVIRFFPTPTAVHTVTLYYTTGIFITASSDTFAGQQSWAEWICLDVCRKIRAREEAGDADLRAAQQEVEDTIRASSSTRDEFKVTTIGDVSDYGDWSYDYYPRRRY